MGVRSHVTGQEDRTVKGVTNVTRPTIDLDCARDFYSLLGKASIALANAGRVDEENELVRKAIGVSSYGELLTLCQEYVEIQNEGNDERTAD